MEKTIIFGNTHVLLVKYANLDLLVSNRVVLKLLALEASSPSVSPDWLGGALAAGWWFSY